MNLFSQTGKTRPHRANKNTSTKRKSKRECHRVSQARTDHKFIADMNWHDWKAGKPKRAKNRSERPRH